MGGCSCRNSVKIYIKETTIVCQPEEICTEISEETQWRLIFESACGDKIEENNLKLLKLEPSIGILGVLDLVFDFLNFEDLQICQGLCSICLHLFNSQNLQLQVLSPSQKLLSVNIGSPPEKTNAETKRVHRKGPAPIRHHSQNGSGSPESPMKRISITPVETIIQQKIAHKLEKLECMLDPIQEDYEQDALMSAQTPNCKEKENLTFNKSEESFSSEDFSSVKSSTLSEGTDSSHEMFGNRKFCVKNKDLSMDKTSNTSGYCKSPAIPVAKKVYIKMNHTKKNLKRPTLAKTMTFNEHMNEIYSDNSHYEKCLVTIDSQDLSQENCHSIANPSSKMITMYKKRNSLALRHANPFKKDMEAIGFIKHQAGRMLIRKDLQSIEE